MTKKSISWALWAFSVAGLGLMFLLTATDFMYQKSDIAFFIFVLTGTPVTEYLKKRKLQKLKKEFNVEDDISFEELEALRIEREYQENFVKKWKLKHTE